MIPVPLRPFVCSLVFSLLAASDLSAQVATALLVEAEDAALGSSLGVGTADGVSFITANTNFTGSFPSSADTVATFSVTFPEAGDYEVYARIYIGPAAASDDSFIIANSLGDAAVGASGDWSVVNGLWNVGFSDPDEMILSVGEVGTQAWKWIRLSTFSEGGILTAPEGQLTQIYKLASREDGLRIDKLAFGPLRVTFTVGLIENGLPGWDQRQPDDGEDFQPTGPILAHGKSKFLGSVWSSDPANNKDFEFYWNGMWHGNAAKWGSVEGTRDVMNWTVVDQGYDYAKANDVAFNFHVLLWGAQQPGWISALSPEEQREEILEWFKAVADGYPEIDYLQVVNEPLNAPPDGEEGRANYMDALGGEGETGFDWILEGFRLARQYFPDTPLMINEYSIESNSELTDRYLEIIEALQAEDLIDLVGFQGHAFSTKFANAVDLEAGLEKIASTGLPIMITEMEVDGHDDFIQLEEYKRIFPIYWEHPSVIGVNISGHIGNWRYDQGAYLVNDNFTERLALKWLREYVAGAGWPSFEGYLAERELDPQTHHFSADVDGDMLATGMEYFLGLDPEVPDAEGSAWTWPNGLAKLSLSLAADRSEGRVEIQSSPDLSVWETQASYDLHFRKASGLSVVSEGERVDLEFEGEVEADPALFYRVRFAE